MVSLAACVDEPASEADGLLAEVPQVEPFGEQEWELALRGAEGALVSLVVHFDAEDLECDGREPAELEAGVPMRVQSDGLMMMSDPPQVVASRIICDD